jgi:hypothetical protein
MSLRSLLDEIRSGRVVIDDALTEVCESATERCMKA